jgi:hypothetical protein
MDSPEWKLCKLTLDRLITAVYKYGRYATSVLEPKRLRSKEIKLTEEENVESFHLQEEIANTARHYINAVEQYNNAVDPTGKRFIPTDEQNLN